MLGYTVAGAKPPAALLLICPLHRLDSGHAHTVRAESEAADMTAARDAPDPMRRPAGSAGSSARLRAVLPHGGSLPEEDWRGRHR